MKSPVCVRSLLIAVLLGVLTPRTARAEDVPIGTNLGGVLDWATSLPFVDVFKNGRPLFSGSSSVWEDGRALHLDARGWVTSLDADQVARTVMCWGIGGHYPSGRYVVLFDGVGTLEWTDNVRVMETSAGRLVLDVDNRGIGIGLTITSTNPANYLRNIRIRMPADVADSEVFNPMYVEKHRGYRVLRFNQWLLGEDARWYTQETWLRRPQLEDAQWSTNGPPLEVMLDLCNRLHADAWFCIPTRADDDYVLHFAQFVTQRLDAGLKVYVEYSNEVFNEIFPEYQYAEAEGLRRGLGPDPFQARMRFYTLRSRQIFEIFERVIPRDRLTRVLAAWCEFPQVAEAVLSDPLAVAHTDALAIAPYWGMWDENEEPAVLSMSLDQFLNYLQNTALPTVLQQVAANREVARSHGLPMIAYEGGLDLRAAGPFADNTTINDLFDGAARSPRMGSIYDLFLQGWQAAGGGLLVHFNDCDGYGPSSGRWGALEYIAEPRSQAPKYDALMRWIEQHAPSARPAQIAVGLGRGGNGSIPTFDDATRGFAALGGTRAPWAACNYANGETRLASGDVDGDGRDELVVSFGRCPQAGGYAVVLDDAQAGYRVLAWLRLPDQTYDAMNGETWPACGDVDGDGRAEVLLGTGAAPGRAGYVQVFDDARGGFAPIARISCGRAAYIAASGEVHPACGDVDGDGRAEIVLGYAASRADGGYVDVFDDAPHGYARVRSFRVQWSAYNASSGAVWPACGDLDGRGTCGIVLGLGRGSNGIMEVFRGADGQYAHRAWVRVPWDAYGAANGETRPCCGDFDGDRRAEIVVGLGRYPGQLGGYMPVFDDVSTGFTLAWWIRAPSSAYNLLNGETRPVATQAR